MQGVLIVSASPSVRKTLKVILQPGRMVSEAENLSESLARGAAEKFDFIFIDGIFEDGSSEELASRLHALGYGPEIVPVLLASDRVYQDPYRQYGVRCFIIKPFNVQQVQQAIEQIEEVLQLSDRFIRHARETAACDLPENTSNSNLALQSQASDDVDVREVSQRFRRLLGRLQSREELVRTFADSMQEQFDVDNVVILLPAERQPVYQIACGEVRENIKAQFSLSFNDPVVQSLIRLGEPVWVFDCDPLSRHAAVSAIRCGERLNVQMLCPVLSRGQLKAIIGLSRSHRYVNRPAGLNLLRLFLTFFAETLENCDLYARIAAAGQVHQAMFEAIDLGMIAVSTSGLIAHLNPAAGKLLEPGEQELQGHPIEKAGSLLAHHAWTALKDETSTSPQQLTGPGGVISVCALPLSAESSFAGAMLVLRPQPPQKEIEPVSSNPAGDKLARKSDEERLWHLTARAIAHNFKNAFVPVQTCADLLPDRYQDEEFRQFFTDTVRQNIERINHWIEQLLNLSLAGQVTDKSSISLREIIERGIEKSRRQDPRAEFDLQVSFGLNDTIVGDRNKLELAFFELITNAMEALRGITKPTISIRTLVSEQGVEVVIEDNGKGIEQSIGKTARDPFVTTTTEGKLGIGLTCAERTIAAHGGKLEIDRQAQSGTRIHISLPQNKAG